jgi:hypothetical protein
MWQVKSRYGATSVSTKAPSGGYLELIAAGMFGMRKARSESADETGQ